MSNMHKKTKTLKKTKTPDAKNPQNSKIQKHAKKQKTVKHIPFQKCKTVKNVKDM